MPEPETRTSFASGVVSFLRHSQRSVVVLALSLAAIFVHGFEQYRGICILIFVGSAVWLLTSKPPEKQPQAQPESPSTQPQPTIAAPRPPDPAAKSEYERLTAFFDQLVRYSLLAIGTILAIAGAFLWKSTNDVKTEADAAIKRTETLSLQFV